MAATGSHLKVKAFGSNVLGVTLEGNKNRPEPDEFRVAFPGGDVSVVRCSDGTYWAHVRVDHEGAGLFNPGEDKAHRITEARLDIVGKSTSEAQLGDFGNEGLYHVAFRVAPKTLTA